MDFIEIQGFKSIKSAKIELKPINILIGGNGSGKSNFLSFFEFLNSLVLGKLQEYIGIKGGLDKILFQGRKVTENLSFKVEFKNGKNGYSVDLILGESSILFKNEKLHYNKDDGENINYFKSESQLGISDNFRKKYVISEIKQLKKYHFHDTGIKSPFNEMSHIVNDVKFLYEKGSNLAAYLFEIQQKHPIAYSRIIYTIKSVAPYFLDFYFSPNENGYLSLFWNDRYCNNIYGVNDLSDGTIRFIALCTLFLQPNLPSTIIIDEPEIGLHPDAIWKLSGLIQSAAGRGCQVILATQSSDLIRYFEPEDVITVDNLDGETIFNRLKTENLEVWLEDYKLDELWKNSTIQTGQPNYRPEVLNNGI